MRKKAWTLTSMTMILALLLAACAPAPAAVPKQAPAATPPATAPAATPKPATLQPQYGGVMTGWLAKEPPNTDPNQETTIFQQQVLRGIYSSLLRDDPDQQPEKVVIIGDLAEKWETSQDGKTWTFTLRDGVKFHDGKPLTSVDVKFTFERMIRPPEGVKSPNKNLFEQIGTIDAPDPRTVRIQLKQATAWFPQLMADNTATIVPKHLVEPNQKALLLRALGSGPFKFKEWDRGVSFTVTKNEAHYVKGRPYLDGIRWIVIPDSSTQVAAFRAGQIMMTGQGSRGLSATEAKIVEKEVAGVQLVRCRPATRFELFINVKKAPFTDVRVRRAALMVLDGKAVYDLAYEGMGFVGGPLTGEWSLPKEELDKIPPVRGPRDSDIAEAKKLLTEAGFPNGFKTTYAQGNLSPYEEMQLAISNQLKKIGIDVTVRVLAYPVELRNALTKGDFEITQIGKVSSIDDPDSHLTNYLTGNPENYSQFSDAKIDELYKQQGAILDFAQRKKITDEFQRRIWELAPAWTTFWPQYIAAAGPKVKGWKGMQTLRQNLVFDTVWLVK
ncbi:MAG: ABC transporter substrate-binding protein [Chloroflexi bacterium]|nr:ABC transporter substrate-binding protein [Chloroflexota bacterium]